MKSFFTLLILISSTQLFARQYIQCGTTNSWDGAVINLDGENSTLFMTNGVHLPDEDRVDVLKDLHFDHNSETHAVFVTDTEDVQEVVHVPLSVIGKYSQSFAVTMEHIRLSDGYSYAREMYCFSAIYED